MTEAERLRQQCDQIMALRHELTRWQARAEKQGLREWASKFYDLEAWALTIEEEVMNAADRLDPPPTRIGGQQWLKGLTVPAVRQ